MAGGWCRIPSNAAASPPFTDNNCWTKERFRARQARLYAQAITAAITELAEGPMVAGSRARGELGIGVRILPIARRGRRGRHLLVYRSASDDELEVPASFVRPWTFPAMFPAT